MEAKSLLKKLVPSLIIELENDRVIRRYSIDQLNQENKRYGFHKDDVSHPYYVINYIRQLIEKYLISYGGDLEIDVCHTNLSQLKDKIPLSQIMSLYLVPVIIYGK